MPGGISTLKGIAFPFQIGTQSFPRSNEGLTTVVDAVKSLLMTGLGEIPMNPTVGTRVYDFIFDTVTPLARARVAQEIRTTIEENEPRMRVLSVVVSTEGDDLGGYQTIIRIEYELNGVSGSIDIKP